MLLASDFSQSAAQLHTGGARSAVARILSSTGLVPRALRLPRPARTSMARAWARTSGL